MFRTQFPIRDRLERKYSDWQEQLKSIRGFDPVLVGYGGQAAAQADEPAVGGADLTMTPTVISNSYDHAVSHYRKGSLI